MCKDGLSFKDPIDNDVATLDPPMHEIKIMRKMKQELKNRDTLIMMAQHMKLPIMMRPCPGHRKFFDLHNLLFLTLRIEGSGNF